MPETDEKRYFTESDRPSEFSENNGINEDSEKKEQPTICKETGEDEGESEPCGEKKGEEERNFAEEKESSVPYEYRGGYNAGRNRRCLCFALISLIGCLFCGAGIFFAVPTLVRSISARRNGKSQTLDWAIAVSAVSVVLNLVIGVLFFTYLSAHYTPPELPEEPGSEEGESAAALISFVLR